MTQMKQAYINARVAQFKANVCSPQNIVMEKGKVLGLGYLPDEDSDTLEVFDLNGCVILPNVFDVLVIDEVVTRIGEIDLMGMAERGYQSLLVKSNEFVDKKSLATFYGYSFGEAVLPLYGVAPLTTGDGRLVDINSLRGSGAVGFYMDERQVDAEALKEGFSECVKNDAPVVVPTKNLEYFKRIIEINRTIGARLCMMDIDTKEAFEYASSDSRYFVGISIANQARLEWVTKGLKDKRIHGLYPVGDQPRYQLPALLGVYRDCCDLLDLLALVSRNMYTFFSIKPEPLSLTNRPNIVAINFKADHSYGRGEYVLSMSKGRQRFCEIESILDKDLDLGI